MAMAGMSDQEARERANEIIIWAMEQIKEGCADDLKRATSPLATETARALSLLAGAIK